MSQCSESGQASIVSLNCLLRSCKIIWSRSTTSNNCSFKFTDVSVIFRVPQNLPRRFLEAKQGTTRQGSTLPLKSSAFIYMHTPGFSHTISFEEKRKIWKASTQNTLFISYYFISNSKMSYCRRQPLNGLFLKFNINASGDFLISSWLMPTPLFL